MIVSRFFRATFIFSPTMPSASSAPRSSSTTFSIFSRFHASAWLSRLAIHRVVLSSTVAITFPAGLAADYAVWVRGSNAATLLKWNGGAWVADGALGAYRHEGYWGCLDTYKDAVVLEEEAESAPWLRGRTAAG